MFNFGNGVKKKGGGGWLILIQISLIGLKKN
jgi:hypothetical protein